MSGPSLSAVEVIKGELEKFETMKTEMENAVRDRDSLKKEVENLRLEKIESDKIAQFYKNRVCELEQRMLNSNDNSTVLPNSAETPPILSSNKRKRKAEDDSETKAGYTYEHAIDVSEKINQAKGRNITGATSRITQIINKIKINLKKEKLEKFEQSCFGHLLEIGELKFQGKLVLHLLMHIDMGASNTENLVFNINNTRVEFGPREFSLITGLRLGTLEEATIRWTSSSSIQEKVFIGKPLIFLKDIEDHFLNASRVGKDRDEMALKLALLYFLYGILFSGNYCKQIDQKYLDLAEDLNKFNAFPWGRVAYEFLASSLLSARSSFDSDSSKPCIFIYGFSFALLVWAYEVMPSLARYCAAHVNNSEDKIPRILRWSTLKKMNYFNDLEKFFTPGDEEHLVLDGIRASPWELEALATGTIPPQPKNETSFTAKDKMSPAATPASSVNAPTHLRACASTQTSVHPKMQTQLVEERCLSSAAGDVVIISDSDGDDDEVAAAFNSQSMKKLLAKIQRETSSK